MTPIYKSRETIALELSQIDTFGCQQNGMVHTGVQRQVYEACSVLTAVCQKAYLGMKRHQKVEKSSP